MVSEDMRGHGRGERGVSRRPWLGRALVLATAAACAIGGGLIWAHGSRALAAAEQSPAGFTFVQISDTHIGFHRKPNTDPVATLREAVAQINAMPTPPDFIIHTGDASDLTRPTQYDTLDQVLSGLKVRQIYYLPGEHDVIGDDGKLFFSRYAKQAQPGGWYSFDHKGVHFLALIDVVNRPSTGAGHLGHAQLAWAMKDLKAQSAQTPIVVLSHIPLWTVYSPWGWNTDDADTLATALQRFGSVTVLNGHIHQIQENKAGNLTYRTARATAFPQPEPGKAPAPGPLVVPADQLQSYLGWRRIEFAPGNKAPTVTDVALASAAAPLAAKTDPGQQATVDIKEFKFVPADLKIAAGTTVTWINHDDEAHTIQSDDKTFVATAQVVEAGGRYSFTFDKPGVYPYTCGIHPYMHGKITVK